MGHDKTHSTANINVNTTSHSELHVTPIMTYVKVAGALYALTVLTVLAYQFRHAFGPLAAPIAFLIASIKAALVLLWFMHLKEDKMMNRVIFGTGFFFLALLFAFSALDIWTRIAEHSTL
ncbi:MAG: cytochrome C oxidase subunit IV family protein [Bdellovibrionaceae bacterium]|nr:cytochrome C oxidase subunit IV family protein [Pseudobdellovibrionaceae bacterium]